MMFILNKMDLALKLF